MGEILHSRQPSFLHFHPSLKYNAYRAKRESRRDPDQQRRIQPDQRERHANPHGAAPDARQKPREERRSADGGAQSLEDVGRSVLVTKQGGDTPGGEGVEEEGHSGSKSPGARMEMLPIVETLIRRWSRSSRPCSSGSVIP
jgi:hypothetical protein